MGKCGFAGLPSTWHEVPRGPLILKGSKLAQHFSNVPSQRASENFYGLDLPIRVNQKAAPAIQFFPLIINSI